MKIEIENWNESGAGDASKAFLHEYYNVNNCQTFARLELKIMRTRLRIATLVVNPKLFRRSLDVTFYDIVQRTGFRKALFRFGQRPFLSKCAVRQWQHPRRKDARDRRQKISPLAFVHKNNDDALPIGPLILTICPVGVKNHLICFRESLAGKVAIEIPNSSLGELKKIE